MLERIHVCFTSFRQMELSGNSWTRANTKGTHSNSQSDRYDSSDDATKTQTTLSAALTFPVCANQMHLTHLLPPRTLPLFLPSLLSLTAYTVASYGLLVVPLEGAWMTGKRGVRCWQQRDQDIVSMPHKWTWTLPSRCIVVWYGLKVAVDVLG